MNDRADKLHVMAMNANNPLGALTPPAFAATRPNGVTPSTHQSKPLWSPPLQTGRVPLVQQPDIVAHQNYQDLLNHLGPPERLLSQSPHTSHATTLRSLAVQPSPHALQRADNRAVLTSLPQAYNQSANNIPNLHQDPLHRFPVSGNTITPNINSAAPTPNRQSKPFLPQFLHLQPTRQRPQQIDSNLPPVCYQRQSQAQPQLNFEHFQLAAPIAATSTAGASSSHHRKPIALHNPFAPHGHRAQGDVVHLHPDSFSPSTPVASRSLINTAKPIVPRVQPQTTHDRPVQLSAQHKAAELKISSERESERKEKVRLSSEKRKRTLQLRREQQEKAIRARAEKAAATRRRNRERRTEEAKQLEKKDRRRREMYLNMQAGAANGPPPGVLAVGDRVLCRPKRPNVMCDELAEVVLVKVSRNEVYVHFVGRDRRMDRWISVSEVRRVSEEDIKEHQMTNTVKLTRAKQRQLNERNPVSEKETGSEAVARAEKEREERTKVKNIGKIVFGAYELESWYFSPFSTVPEGDTIERIFMCQYCLKYHRHPSKYLKHQRKCAWKEPPGKQVYQDQASNIVVYEIDGMVNIAYSQRLCLLGKLFLDHKTLFFDVAPFLFYVVTMEGEMAGFFSKEKPARRSEFNLACIMTFPHHQKKGIGRFMIEFSYELSKREGKLGSPERPLSDLGQVSYRSFWMYEVFRFACAHRAAVGINVESVSEATRIRTQDVLEVLKSMNMLNIWKGESYIDCSAKTIDNVASRVREPRLKLKHELLDYDVRAVNGNCISPSAASRSAYLATNFQTPNSSIKNSPSVLGKRCRSSKNRSKARTSPHARQMQQNRTSPEFTPENTRSRRASIGSSHRNPNSPATSGSIRTPPSLHLSQSSRAARARVGLPNAKVEEEFESAALKEAFQDFVNKNGILKVLAPIDSKFGLGNIKYRAFGNNFGLSVNKAYNRAKAEAMRMMNAKHMVSLNSDADSRRKERSESKEVPSASGSRQAFHSDSPPMRSLPADDSSTQAMRFTNANGLHAKQSPKAISARGSKIAASSSPKLATTIASRQQESGSATTEHGGNSNGHDAVKRVRQGELGNPENKLSNMSVKEESHREASAEVFKTSARTPPTKQAKSRTCVSDPQRHSQPAHETIEQQEGSGTSRGADVMEVIVISSDDENSLPKRTSKKGIEC